MESANGSPNLRTKTKKLIMKLLNKNIIISLILIFIQVFIDIKLSPYGKGTRIFNNKLPSGIDVVIHPYNGFKIKSEVFILFSEKHKVEGFIVKKIIKYSYTDNFIFCQFIDTYNKSHFVKVSKYENLIINEDFIKKNLTWYNIGEKEPNFVSILVLFRSLLFVIIIVIFYVNRKKK